MKNHFDWPAPNRDDLMYLSTLILSQNNLLGYDYPQKNARSISQDYKYVPQRQQPLLNKESYINRCDDIPIRIQNRLNIERKSMYIEDIPGTKPQIANFQTKTRREVNPVDPVYRLPTFVPVAPPEPNKFVRDTLNIADIPGTEIRIKIRQPRKDNPFYEIEGTKPKTHLRERRNVPTEVEEKVAMRIQRHLDPLQPEYQWENQILGKVQGSQPRTKHYDLNKVKSSCLNTQDIEGAQANTKNPIPKESSKNTNNTQDIYRAQADTIQRGIKTVRQTNPLQPQYQLPGNTEIYK